MEKRFCTGCGNEITTEAAFCPKCGKKLKTPSSKPTNGASTSQNVEPGVVSSTAGTSNNQANVAPVFTPPTDAIAGNQGGDIPTFAPPTAPTFTPPKAEHRVHNGPVCYYHQDEPAVAQCAKCGKYICRDCFDAYGVDSGEYAGQALCYDCTQQLVAENVAILKQNKSSITTTFIFTIIGMIFGAIVGGMIGAEEGGGYIAGGIFLGAMIGGCLWTFIKGFFARMWGAIKGAHDGSFMSVVIGIFVGAIVGFVIEAALSIYRTIRKIIECIVYLKRTSGFIESDSAALQEMADYMEYTLIRNQNRGVDLETLMNEKSELANNSFARMVQEQGEAQAEANIRSAVASINENGEIIRNFAA